MARALPMPPGARLVALAFRIVPGLQAARLDAERLARLRARALPERGPVARLAGLMVGTVPDDVAVHTEHHGSLPLRIYRPRPQRSRGPVVLAMHGGGFVLGSARQQDWLHGQVARRLGAVVVAPDYRLAPEHPFPAALDDCWAALAWTAEHAARLGGDPTRLGVLGESAGGNLAAVTCLRAAREGAPRVGHQALLYPPTDLTDGPAATASYAEHADAAIASAAALRVFRDLYLGPGGEHGDPADPRCSPALADPAGLPPTLVLLAGHDPLRDSGAAYADALVAAGTRVRVVEHPAMPHGFLGFPGLARDSRAAVRAVTDDQRRVLRA